MNIIRKDEKNIKLTQEELNTINMNINSKFITYNIFVNQGMQEKSTYKLKLAAGIFQSIIDDVKILNNQSKR